MTKSKRSGLSHHATGPDPGEPILAQHLELVAKALAVCEHLLADAQAAVHLSERLASGELTLPDGPRWRDLRLAIDQSASKEVQQEVMRDLASTLATLTRITSETVAPLQSSREA